MSQSFFARVFSSVFNARYSDCCVIAFCTCFLEHFCKCVAGMLKLCIFLVFSRFKLTWYRDWFCTYFVVYFDDLAYFYTTQLARLCADFRFIEFFLLFLIVFMSITWRHFECTCSMGVWKYSFSRVFRALLVVLHVFSRLFWLLAGCLAMAGLAGWLLGGYLDDGFGFRGMSRGFCIVWQREERRWPVCTCFLEESAFSLWWLRAELWFLWFCTCFLEHFCRFGCWNTETLHFPRVFSLNMGLLHNWIWVVFSRVFWRFCWFL